MSDKKQAVYWTCREVERLQIQDPDEAVEEFLDITDPAEWPRTLKVEGFAPEDPPDAEGLANSICEDLDNSMCDLADPDGDINDVISDKVRAAALVFAKVFVEDFTPWRCEVVDELTVDVATWVTANRDNWIAESSEVRAFLDAVAADVIREGDPILADGQVVAVAIGSERPSADR
jgi:hypothetical protein